jgi:RNA polymerase sigma-70 factor, ECF subfamily
LADYVHILRPMYQASEANEPVRPRYVFEPGNVAEYRGGRGVSGPPSSRDADEGLIDSVLQGRTDAFGTLVAPYLGSLTRFARMRLRNQSEAEDVVQQAVLQAFYGLSQFRREASFKTWLSKIASNEVIHLRRGRAIAPVKPLHEALAGKLADPTSLPDMQIQQKEEREHLHRALARLPEKYRLVIQLRDLHELSTVATARSLCLSVGAVKTRHHRARKLLLRSLGTNK